MLENNRVIQVDQRPPLQKNYSPEPATSFCYVWFHCTGSYSI